MTYRYAGQRPRLSAAELNRQNETADRAAFDRRGLLERVIPDDQQSHWVWLRNDSGEDRLRFDCMALGEPLFDLTDDGTVDLLFSADTADADKTPVILLEPIADGDLGKGVIQGLAIARVGPGDTSSRLASPDGDNHWLSPGEGPVKLLAAPTESGFFDDIFDDFFDDFFGGGSGGAVYLPVLLGAGGSSGGVSSWYVYTLTADMSGTGPWTATANLLGVGGADNETGVTVTARASTATHQVSGD
ncbi:MAG: hypothetical protein KDA45_07290, partial [Planctomycetales bacterium]|nr:hypothetical protein [Planctomycetales bacterium]